MPEVLVPQNSDTVPLALYVGRVEPIACALERQRDGRQFRMKWIDQHCPRILVPLVWTVAFDHLIVTLAPSADYDSEVTLAAVAVLAGLVVLLLTSEADELIAPLVPT